MEDAFNCGATEAEGDRIGLILERDMLGKLDIKVGCTLYRCAVNIVKRSDRLQGNWSVSKTTIMERVKKLEIPVQQSERRSKR